MSLRCLGTSGYNEAQFRPNYLGKVYEAAQQNVAEGPLSCK